MKEMYKGMVNSPQTKIDQAINAADTDIKVKDGSVFPPGPNLATIGIDQHAETILYSAVNNNILVGCTRGYQGAAENWESNSPIARNFTEADLAAVQENIRTLDEKTLADMTEDSLHRTVSDDEKSSWNKKVDKVEGKGLSTNDFTDAAKKKVDAIPPNPKYTDTIQNLTSYAKKTDVPTKISQLSEDATHRTVSDDEKDAWNNKVDKIHGKQLSTNDFTDLFKAKLQNLSVFASNIDADGIYKTVDYKDKNGALVFKTQLIGTGPRYDQIKLNAYQNNILVNTQIWNLTYDDNDFLYKKEMQ